VNPLDLAFKIANTGFECKTSKNRYIIITGIFYTIMGFTGAGVRSKYCFYISG
jgi:hypothetical protein